MRLRILRGVLGSASLVAMVATTIAACGAGGDKNGANGGPDGGGDDGGIQLDGGTGLCNACVGTVYQTCDASGKVTSTTECAPRVCVAGRGCLDCTPGGNTCVGNEVHACTDSGSVGPLVTTCDPGKAEVCSNGACKNACDVAADSPSNVGCEFWAVDLDNEYSQFNDAAGAPWGVVLANTSTSTATVTIEKNDAPLGSAPSPTSVYSKSILPGSLDQVILPTREVDGSVKAQDDGPGTFVSSNAYRITSTAPLVVYQFNPMAQTFSNDASLLIPRNGLGTIHRVLGWPTGNPINPGIPIAGIPDHSFVTIVGTAPSTTVTVTVGSDVVGGGGIAATKKGGTITQTIGPFDVINIESDGLYGDMTGTIVESTAPVAVYTGGERGIAPYSDPFPPPPPSYDASKGVCCTDHLEEQVFPVTSMGKKFVVARSPIRSTGGYVEYDMIKFMGVAATTTVKTSLPPPDDNFTLAPGEQRLTWTNADFVAEATEPLAIAQMLVSQEYTESPRWGGDPSLTIFPPVDQFRKEYLFLVPTSWEADFVVIAMPEGTNVSIDGKPIGAECDGGSAGDVAGVHYVSRRCPIKEGAHGVTGDQPFGVTAYGYGPVGSYAFTGGADVKKIYEPPPLH